MFDIGFLELLVIAIVALVVIGPEKLPDAVKTCAIWISRVKRALLDARTEFEQQIGADEIRREIHNEQIMRSLQKLKQHRDDIEHQIRNASVTDEEKYEDTHQPEGANQSGVSPATKKSESTNPINPSTHPVANTTEPSAQNQTQSESLQEEQKAQDSNSNK